MKLPLTARRIRVPLAGTSGVPVPLWPGHAGALGRAGLWVVLVLLCGVADASVLPGGGRDSAWLRVPVLGEYANYAEDPYVPYRTRLRQEKRYSFLGDFLGEGVRAFRLEERRPGTSIVAKDDVYRSLFNNLVLARTTYAGIDVALTIGDEIRTLFTPLTLQRAGLNCVRWDASVRHHRLTLLAVRGFDATDFPGYETFSVPVQLRDLVRQGYADRYSRALEVVEENPAYTLGARWESDMGGVVTLGATVLTQQQLNADADGHGKLLHGGVPYPEMRPPEVIRVRLSDDSPADGSGGAAVFALFCEIEGTAAGVDTSLSTDPRSPQYSADLTPVRTGGRPVGSHWEANGTDELVYAFQVPAQLTPRRVRFRVRVGNDYRIAVSQRQYVSKNDVREYRDTPYLTLVRAAGNTQDLSNIQERVVEYGLYSAQTMYGVDVTVDLAGLDLQGEVVLNRQYRRFPVLGGRYTDPVSAAAWYVHGVREWDPGMPVNLGVELFDVPAGFGGGYPSRRGGLVLYSDLGGLLQNEQVLAEYPLVEDNDDRDRYADDNANDFPGATTWEAGVYPGLDEDGDGVPDEDRNANGTPDYEEPFLLYRSDPQEFVYGMDMNNNGVIDVRENDDRPDYPYPRDRCGGHLRLSVRPRSGLTVGAGYYRMRAPAMGRTARSAYGHLACQGAAPRWGQVQLKHDTKRVQDRIPDPVYVYDPDRLVTPLEPPDPDPLHQRNSWVHTTFCRVVLSRLAPLRLEGSVQHRLNRQLDRAGLPVQQEDGRERITWVARAAYERRWHGLRLRPRYKALWHRLRVRSASRPLTWRFQSAPMLLVDWVWGDNLGLQFGQQGLGLHRYLMFRSIDRVRPLRSYSATDSVFMVTLAGDYMGARVTTSSGIHMRRKDFDEPDAGEDMHYTRLFVDAVVTLGAP